MCNSAAKQVSAGVPACYITGRTSFGNVVVGKCFVLEKNETKDVGSQASACTKNQEAQCCMVFIPRLYA